ncbi:PQQ-dependent sugar dehydrogenase [Dyadobacter aurulentus]|uniref:PQQ-dependent sugar dehydrogenase n=1 Tax=Dyadobacter sp. UC 10 TaxID=2605428 RepID=UPI0011F10AEC|nr:PQQ-dependent sugar dehydrogenase [Dyadobacter sp. UC 10]KAA0992830.1 c-type cytochrome [Dyadobacter sp. UC 10]
MIIQKYLVSLVFTAGFFNSAFSQVGPATTVSPTAGKEIFTTYCASCHALEAEEIGPRLGGVTRIFSGDELVTFIKNPSAVIDRGNKRAAALARRYKMIMPPFDFLKDEEIKSIIAYLDAETKSLDLKPLAVNTEEAVAKPERLAAPVTKSGLKIELEDFVTIPFSSEKMPRTRIAFTRPGPQADGSIYVSDQRGIIYKLQNKQINTFLDIRPLVADFINEPGLGTGLGSFAFHPDYLRNGLIYITHTETFKGKPADYEFNDTIKVAMQWVVSEWKINDVKSTVFEGTRRELLRINVPGAVHGIQEIAFQPGIDKKHPDYGLLYIGIGDGSSTISGYPELCHTLKSPLGTILRIDPLGRNSRNKQYGIPKSNPFVTKKDRDIYKEIYAYGFRNPHRMTWYNGKLFCAEVSEANFEEINVVVKGGDFGWNIREGNYGISFKDLKNVFKIDNPDSLQFIKPFALYDHYDGNAISGGHVYDGNIAALKNKYIFGDITSGKLFYINMDKKLSDPAIYELGISVEGKNKSLVEITGSKRVDVRIEYDRLTKEMYIMTKPDGKIRRIKNAFVEATK